MRASVSVVPVWRLVVIATVVAAALVEVSGSVRGACAL